MRGPFRSSLCGSLVCVVGCSALLVCGCLFGPEKGVGLLFELQPDVSRRGCITVEVTCTNTGDEAKSVTMFLQWGSEPWFSVKAPDGTIYFAQDVSNITPVRRRVLLGPGESMSKTYDLLGAWRTQNGDGWIPGTRVFSSSGRYTLTATYTPFDDSLDTTVVPTRLVCTAAFELSPDFWS